MDPFIHSYCTSSLKQVDDLDDGHLFPRFSAAAPTTAATAATAAAAPSTAAATAAASGISVLVVVVVVHGATAVSRPPLHLKTSLINVTMFDGSTLRPQTFKHTGYEHTHKHTK